MFIPNHLSCLGENFQYKHSDPRSYISAMLLALKSLLFFCLDIWNLKLVEFQTAKGK